MCGIAGYISYGADQRSEADRNLAAMTAAILHRGPDSDGGWLDREAGIGLGMRRLAIIDLSPAGHQPMVSESGRYVIVFNGEIYNHRDLRALLTAEGKAPLWKGHSDTEVLLALIADKGLTKALQLANGMFALAVWDRQQRDLALATDRFGEKPLYFGFTKDAFLFGSELKALRAHPSWVGEVSREALTLYFRHGYIPAPHSIYSNVSKVLPAEIVRVRVDGVNRAVRSESYWSTVETALSSSRFSLSQAEAQEEFEALFKAAVKARMEADVPLGAFLSGGFDSTAVVAAMQEQSGRPVQTFTIGFTETAYNEAPFAKAVASHLGTNHTELYVTPQEAMSVIPSLPQLYDEPFADSSQIPTFLVAKLARQSVTVALSGDAGDELFGGYRRYFVANKILPALSMMPNAVRKISASAIRTVGARGIDRLSSVLSFGRLNGQIGDRALRLAHLLDSETLIDGYLKIVSAWSQPADLVVDGIEPATPLSELANALGSLDFVEKMMLLDLISYLPGDILTKVDRATMGVSLEGRIPFLDHRLVEFSWCLPRSYKVSGGVGKIPIREFVYRRVPRKMMDRPKTGFGVPIEDWIRGPLRDWAESLINDVYKNLGHLIRAELVRDAWVDHLAGRKNNQSLLWPVLMFAAWMQHER